VVVKPVGKGATLIGRAGLATHPVATEETIHGKPVRTTLSVTCGLLAFNEGNDIERGNLQYRLLNRVQKDLEIIAIAEHSIKPASVSHEFKISVCFRHSQRDIYNSIHHLSLKSVAQR
jgi:hypothetical protein